MMEVLDYFKLPDSAKLAQRIYVKDVVAALGTTGNDKTLLEKSISTIHLVGILNENNSGLWAFKDRTYLYEEIQIFSIVLKDASKIKQLNEVVQKVFPNPIIVIYKYGNQYLLSTAMKRLHKVEVGRTVIDSIQTTNWFGMDQLHADLLSRITYNRRDLKDFYESIDYIISAEYITQLSGHVPAVIDFSIKAKSLMIQQLLDERRRYVKQEEEESSMQGKMQCHMKIKEIDQKLEVLKQ